MPPARQAVRLFFSRWRCPARNGQAPVVCRAATGTDRLRRGALTDEEWPALTAAAKRLCVLPFELDDSQGLTPISLKIRAREVRRKYGDLGLIVLDYLQLMRVPGVR